MRRFLSVSAAAVLCLWSSISGAATLPPSDDFTVSVFFQKRVILDQDIDLSTGQVMTDRGGSGFTEQSIVIHSTGMTVERQGSAIMLLGHGDPVFEYDSANKSGRIDFGRAPNLISRYVFNGSRGSFRYEDDDDPIFRVTASELRSVNVMFTPLGVAATDPAMTVVPLPASFSLLAAGVGVFAFLRRRIRT